MKSELIQFFGYGHLPAHLQPISKPFGELAESLVALTPEELCRQEQDLASNPTRKLFYDLSILMDGGLLPCNVEATWAVMKIGEAQRLARDEHGLEAVLRRLLEAKDCAVRSLVYKHPT